MMKLFLFVGAAFLTLSSGAHQFEQKGIVTEEKGFVGPNSGQPVLGLADLRLLQQLRVPVISADQQLRIGYAVLSPQQQLQMSELAHRAGKCGGFEALPSANARDVRGLSSQLMSLKQHIGRDLQYARGPVRRLSLPKRPEIEQAVAMAQEANVLNWVKWLSAFPNRYNKDPNANAPILQLKSQLEKMLSGSRRAARVELIDHTSTQQKSIRVRLMGTSRAQEIIVLGGHVDSINLSGGNAPGADDNASGSANLIEALRVLLTRPPTARTIDFFWYAGEESGLLGSAEISKQYKSANAKVVGVLQLDMTMFPGNGEMVIGSMTDYTSSWLREILTEINKNYLNVKIVEDQCGYACSDHATWYRQGYPTLMPFEATMRTMNRNIHTARDVISDKSNFQHSLIFSKLAIALALELGNSSAQQPY